MELVGCIINSWRKIVKLKKNGAAMEDLLANKGASFIHIRIL
jgi:hypothetical protein